MRKHGSHHGTIQLSVMQAIGFWVSSTLLMINLGTLIVFMMAKRSKQYTHYDLF